MTMSFNPKIGPLFLSDIVDSVFLRFWGSLTGAHPGLFTSENRNAFESYWDLTEIENKKK